VVYFDDPNLGCVWEVHTYWVGQSLVTSERTPDGALNGGRPIVISRWVEADGQRLISRAEWVTDDGSCHQMLDVALTVSSTPAGGAAGGADTSAAGAGAAASATATTTATSSSSRQGASRGNWV